MTYDPSEYEIMRPATAEEIATFHQHSIETGRKVVFRHFVVEIKRGNGWMKRNYSCSTLRVIKGKVCVVHHGKLREVAAQYAARTQQSKINILDLRIKSEFLPTLLQVESSAKSHYG